MKDITGIVASSGKVVEEVYSDAVSASMREASKIGVDAVKTIRLALFPLQFTAALQDRLASYINKAIEQVPEDRRVTPMESLVLPIADKLKHQETDNPLSNLYVNLLSRGIDRDRLGEAHPAFLNVISQLAPDEIVLVDDLGKKGCRIWWRLKENKKNALLRAESDALIEELDFKAQTKNKLSSMSVTPETLGNPELFLTFLEHLVSLGLVSYTNEYPDFKEITGFSRNLTAAEFYCIELSEFGSLFYKACVKS